MQAPLDAGPSDATADAEADATPSDAAPDADVPPDAAPLFAEDHLALREGLSLPSEPERARTHDAQAA